ncbi:MAG: hypothetical protein ACRDLU_05235 [Gaiellaceae bacterium]
MGLAAQWDAMVAELPAGWPEIGLRLRLARPEDAARAAALLGSLSPGVAGGDLHLRATSEGEAGPSAIRRLLARLDESGIGGTLELAGEVAGAAAESVAAPTRPLAAAWDELVAGLPEDWSDLLCLVELRSSDELDPAALALAPVNPSRHEGTLGFRFRVARHFGYGAAPGMARRCLERLDEAGTPGRLTLLEAFSDTQPVLTQGPTFVVSDRAV